MEGPREKGEAFCKWLKGEGKVDTQARLRNLACDRQEGPRSTGGKTDPRCGRCHKAGHRRIECRGASFLEMTGSANASAAELSGGRTRGGGEAPGGDAEHLSQYEWAVKLKTAGGSEELLVRLLNARGELPDLQDRPLVQKDTCMGRGRLAQYLNGGLPGLQSRNRIKESKTSGRSRWLQTMHLVGSSKKSLKPQGTQESRPSARTIKCQEKIGAGVCGKEHH